MKLLILMGAEHIEI